MHRKALLSQLQLYRPYADADRAAFQEILDFVSNNPGCFDRTLLAGHITGSSWIVNPDRTKALLTHHAKLGMWLQMGGHCDGDSDVLAVACKEAVEESGLALVRVVNDSIFDLDVHPIPAHNDIPAHRHYDVRYLLEADDSLPLIVSAESKEIRWVNNSELERFTTEPSMIRMRAKAAAMFGS